MNTNLPSSRYPGVKPISVPSLILTSPFKRPHKSCHLCPVPVSERPIGLGRFGFLPPLKSETSAFFLINAKLGLEGCPAPACSQSNTKKAVSPLLQKYHLAPPLRNRRSPHHTSLTTSQIVFLPRPFTPQFFLGERSRRHTSNR